MKKYVSSINMQVGKNSKTNHSFYLCMNSFMGLNEALIVSQKEKKKELSFSLNV